VQSSIDQILVLLTNLATEIVFLATMLTAKTLSYLIVVKEKNTDQKMVLLMSLVTSSVYHA
jgi:hypothetical protein